MTDHPAGAPGDAAPDRIRIAPASRIPLRDQIAVQLLGALRAGRHEPGDRLPSVRGLARSLGVHRSTVRAAYRRLAAAGRVSVRPGAGVYVADVERDPFRRFLVREREAGRTFRETAALMDRWRAAAAARRVTVTGSDPTLREIWAAELRAALAPAGVEVACRPPGDLGGRPPEAGGSLVAAPAATHRELADRLPRWTEVVALRPGLSPRVRRLLVRLPQSAVVAAVTRSEPLARELTELATSLRGGDVAVVWARPGTGPRLVRALRVARFVLTDMPCRAAVRPRIERRRLLTLRHLPPETGRELARCFAAPPAEGNGRPAAGDADARPRREETRRAPVVPPGGPDRRDGVGPRDSAVRTKLTREEACP